MVREKSGSRLVGFPALLSVGVVLWLVDGAFGIQAPYQVPATHERQCVSTGDIAPGDTRTITLTWKHPFATSDYDVIGSVSESGQNVRAIELGHIVIPHTPTEVAAVVSNHDATAARSAILCLDASAE